MLGVLGWVPAWLQVTLGLLVTALTLAYFYLTSTFGFWRERGVRFIKPLPLFGSVMPLMTMQEHMLVFFQRVYRQFEGDSFIGYFQGRSPSVFIRDPELAKHVLVKDFTHFVNHGFTVHEEADPLEAKNLFNLEGQRWRDMRTKLAPTFTSGRMKAMFPLMQECAQQLEEHLGGLAKSGDEFETKDIFSRYTTDVIGSCVFGFKVNCLQDPTHQFRVMGKKLVEMDFWRGVKGFILVFLPSVGLRLRLTLIDAELTNFFRNLVRDVMEMRKRTGETRKDFMQLLIELKDKGRLSAEEHEEQTKDENEHVTNLQLTHDDVTAQATVFFMAGFDTSSTLMSFAVLELAVNPDVQRKTQTEIDEVLQRHDGQLSYQAFQEMQYLDWVLQETLRKYPPVPGLMRVCTKNYVIPGTNINIEEGTAIAIPIHAIQNDPKYFPDPDRFDPERFSDDQSGRKNQYVHMPFGEGPRQCIGNRFALMQSKLGLISLLRKFNVHKCARTAYPVTLDIKEFILTNSTKIWVTVTPRNEE